MVGELIEQGQRWLDDGATQLIIKARERGVGRPRTVIFEAPTKPDQFALIDHFGREVCLSNERLEELLCVEIYRIGLHSDAFLRPNLRPRKPLYGGHESGRTADKNGHS